jgi:hypothetical protein
MREVTSAKALILRKEYGFVLISLDDGEYFRMSHDTAIKLAKQILAKVGEKT